MAILITLPYFIATIATIIYTNRKTRKGNYDDDKSKGNYDDDKSKGNYDDDKSKGNYDDDKSKGNYDDDKSKGNYDDDKSKGNYDDDKSKGNYDDDKSKGTNLLYVLLISSISYGTSTCFVSARRDRFRHLKSSII